MKKEERGQDKKRGGGLRVKRRGVEDPGIEAGEGQHRRSVQAGKQKGAAKNPFSRRGKSKNHRDTNTRNIWNEERTTHGLRPRRDGRLPDAGQTNQVIHLQNKTGSDKLDPELQTNITQNQTRRGSDRTGEPDQTGTKH